MHTIILSCFHIIDEESVVENKKKNGKRKKHSRNNDASNGNKQDFLSILEQFVRPLLPM